MQIQKNIAATLKHAMEVNQKTKLEFSKELGIPRSTLQTYLKGERNLRSDSIEEVAKALGMSPAQLIAGPGDTCVPGPSGLELILPRLEALRHQAHALADMLDELAVLAQQLSGEQSAAEEATPEWAENSACRYTVYETKDPFCAERSYGILCKERRADDWATTAAVAAFSGDRDAVSLLAQRCTKLQLSPVHLPDVISDFLAQEQEES